MANLSNENIVHIEGNVSYIQFKKLLEYPEIKHAFTIDRNLDFRTHFQNAPHSNYKNAINNYNKLITEVKASSNIAKTYQEHSSEVLILNKIISLDLGYLMPKKIDGIITDLDNQTIATTSADCILFLLYDPVRKVIGNIHSGWRGTSERIIVNAITKMQQSYNCQPKDIVCCICPSIRKCHFEVDQDVYEIFKEKFPDYLDLMPKRGPKWFIDTIEINKRLLLEKGVLPENIIDSRICTVCYSNQMHSYRVDKNMYKLNTAIIEKEVI